MPANQLVGIDVGGTFTDLTLYDTATGRLSAFKALSDRAAPERGVLAAMEAAGLDLATVALVVHGTTVATNALLERRGAVVAMVTTEGFRDVIELGRTTRLVPGTLYDPYFRKAPPLVDRRLRFTVRERIARDGAVAEPLDAAELERVAGEIAASGAEAVAVCFLNSFRNDSHERAAAAALKKRAGYVTRSAAVLNEMREYERFSTTVANAYVMPLMASYVKRLVAALRERRCEAAFYTMASNGGLMSATAVAEQPVRTILSGPAAGIAAAVQLGAAIGIGNLITYDMGGTSSDVALISDGGAPLRRETILQGMIIRAPQIDIHTIGAGGGSIASLDAGGSLLVGPESAGSNPGPACYGNGGTRPTVTDANVVLGRLGSDQRLGNTLDIDGAAADAAVATLADQAGMSTADMAAGIVKLAVAKMAAAIYEISVARGRDPRDFTLLPFGGAGPLHACEVAADLGMRRICVPPLPGAFSSYGALCAPLAKDRSATLLRLLDAAAVARLDELFTGFDRALRDEFAAEGVAIAGFATERQIDARYFGQAHEITVTIPAGADEAAIAARFYADFEREFGRLDVGKSIEIVNARLIGRVPLHGPRMRELSGRGGTVPASSVRKIHVEGALRSCPLLQREALAVGDRVEGPAIVEEMSATLYLAPGWTLEVGEFGELNLTGAEA